MKRSDVSRWTARGMIVCGPSVLCLAIAAMALAQDEKKPPAPAFDSGLIALFVANCAPCHGETGDGKGTTKLDKPARSFKDGGFAYGNTPETILRTITNGIPGTQMPSFANAIKDEAKRKSLAQYVISLGPEQIEVKSSDTILVVHDKPLIVRGKLPPIVDGAIERPRGLLIGTPDGLTFEYRTDDVRLLGVRQGGFVDRKDWGGRGGDALQPLGKIVSSIRDGNAASTFQIHAFQGQTAELHARLLSTAVRANRASITYELENSSSADASKPAVIARVEESPSAFSCALGIGYVRDVVVESATSDSDLALRAQPERVSREIAGTVSSENAMAIPRAKDVWELIGIRDDAESDKIVSNGDQLAWIPDFKQSRRREIQIIYLPRVSWSGSAEGLLAAFWKLVKP